MNTFRFKTRISKTGLIKLPKNVQLTGKEVEIIILDNQKEENGKINPDEFIEKWAGFLINSETDISKYNYLSSKYK